MDVDDGEPAASAGAAQDMELSSPASSATGSSSGAGNDTFGNLNTPSLRAQQALLDSPPPMTQPASVKKGVWANLRKPRGHVDIEHTFKHIFKKEHFKGRQREIMDAAIRGYDILAIAPTGMGKVPAVAEEHGVTVVVTPLLSLMENQIQNLRKLNIPCAMLTSRTDRDEAQNINRDLKSGHPKIRLLYVTPERLVTTKFRDILRILDRHSELARLVIDEAHCISEWGHDFRKEYQQLGEFRQMFERIPITALTASATKEVRTDIIYSLDLRLDRLFHCVHCGLQPLEIILGISVRLMQATAMLCLAFNRVNLFYEVRYLDDNFNVKLNNVVNFLNGMYKRRSGQNPDMGEEEIRAIQGIIYCRKKDTCDQVVLSLRAKGVQAAAYHRGLSNKACEQAAELWQDCETRAAQGKKHFDVIVATVAFGMGIDAPTCRYIIHFDLPTSFEGYYQETGRAGRNGHSARCILYYSRRDAEAVRFMASKTQALREKKMGGNGFASHPKKSIDELIKYAENVSQCRHLLICRYFGEKPEESKKLAYCDKFCDVCKDGERVAATRDHLTPQEVVMTQMPDIQSQAEEEWEDQGEAILPLGAEKAPGLPGFAKASHLRKGRASENAPENLSDASMSPEPELPANDDIERPRAGMHADTARDGDQTSHHEEDDRVWVPRKRINRDLSRSESIASHANVAAPAEEVAAQVLSQTPRKSLALAEQLFPEHEIEGEADERMPQSAPTSPPRAPIPKVMPNRPPTGPARFTTVVSAKTNIAAGGASALNKANNGGKTSIVAPTTNLSNVNINTGRSSSTWQVPFKKDHARAPVATLEPLDLSGEQDSTFKFELVPARWDKRIDKKLRQDAVYQFYAVLSRAVLSNSGVRATSEEDDLFDRLSLFPTASASQKSRVTLVKYAALEAETEVFWLSTTSSGYTGIVKQRVDAIKALAANSGWLAAFPDDAGNIAAMIVAKALKKAMKWRTVHDRQQAGQSSLEGHDDDGSESEDGF